MQHIFGWVCGQNAVHTWAPGGNLLPLCQRCTGFYAGAAIALVLLLIFRPQVNRLFRRIHLLLVLGMIPFGFHLVAQGPVIRTVSGGYFGFGVVGLLWLLPGMKLAAGHPGRMAGRCRIHLLLGAAGIALIPAFACWGGIGAAIVLPWIALAGLSVFAGLVASNALLICFSIFSRKHAPLGPAQQ